MKRIPQLLVRLALVAIVFLPSPAKAVDDTPRPLFVEGYAGEVSYQPGEEIALHVSTSAASYAIEIVRFGAKDVIVHRAKGIAGGEHPIPENASSHGCNWPVSWKWKLPENFRTGYYHVKLRVSDRGGKFTHRNTRSAEGSCFFVVRSAHPGRDSKILLQLSANTYNAYNNWGGSSLYAYHGRAKLQGHRVSFDRPPRSQFGNWELHFVRWAEKNGYPVDYAVNSDLEFRPELLKHYRLVLSIGHDEYWSAPMRDHLEAYIRDGGNVAFFSGNSICWQIRSEDEGRAQVCWKQNYHSDPVFQTADHSTLSTLWSHHLVKRPENHLTGVCFLYGGYHKSHGQLMDGSGAFTVHRPEHWLFRGTGLKRGDEFGGKDTIVGYECDGCQLEWRDGLPYPTHTDGTPKSFSVLGTAPAKWHPDDSEWYERWVKGRVGNAVLGVYENGGTVVTSGTTDWAHGLRGGDKTVDRITRNILERLSK
jgi:hypothetical protein